MGDGEGSGGKGALGDSLAKNIERADENGVLLPVIRSRELAACCVKRRPNADGRMWSLSDVRVIATV